MSSYDETDDAGSVGRPLHGYTFKVDETGLTTFEDGSLVGDILAFGPQLTKGYLNDEAATRNAFTAEGWLKTGDIGYIKQGKIYLVDRVKDLIKVNGFSIAPAELENALTEMKDVVDVGVLGVGNDISEHPLAVIVSKSDKVTKESIIAHLRERLSGYKVARCEIRFVDCIPKSPAGKVLKKILREQYTLGHL
jgi:acyl-CoA synthetase (AMP-forming)/AMP-acid ligase II